MVSMAGSTDAVLEARRGEIDVSLLSVKDRAERSSLHYEKGRINKELKLRAVGDTL